MKCETQDSILCCSTVVAMELLQRTERILTFSLPGFMRSLLYFITLCLRQFFCRLSVMDAYLLSHFPSSQSLSCGGEQRRRRRRKESSLLSYLKPRSLKWAMVIHQFPSSPGESVDVAHSLEVPQDSALFLYLCFILFLSLHISLSVSLSGMLLLWPLASWVLICLSLWGWVFGGILIHTCFSVSLVPQQHRAQHWLSLSSAV